MGDEEEGPLEATALTRGVAEEELSAEDGFATSPLTVGCSGDDGSVAECLTSSTAVESVAPDVVESLASGDGGDGGVSVADF